MFFREVHTRANRASRAARTAARFPSSALDVDPLKPGASATIDAKTLGYPYEILAQVPAGDYYVQALMNVYTQFHRADGHVIWVHDDQWEGQHFNTSPGNLVSEVQKMHFDPRLARHDQARAHAEAARRSIVPAGHANG